MATEILMNDGGAPARILPFVASETITAGNVVTMDSSGELTNADTDHSAGFKEYVIGVALTTQTSGNVCSIITGRGVVCKINTTAGDAGKALKVSSTDGRLEDNTALGHTVAIRLETTPGAGLARCLTAY